MYDSVALPVIIEVTIMGPVVDIPELFWIDCDGSVPIFNMFVLSVVEVILFEFKFPTSKLATSKLATFCIE